MQFQEQKIRLENSQNIALGERFDEDDLLESMIQERVTINKIK